MSSTVTNDLNLDLRLSFYHWKIYMQLPAKIFTTVSSIVVFSCASSIAQGDVSTTVTVASDYDFRGITQTALDPTLQASLDWSGESGLYVSLWGSNIDFGQDGLPGSPGFDGAEGLPPVPAVDAVDGVDLNVEVDFTLGYEGTFTDELSYNVGTVYYKYLGNDDVGINDFDFGEVYTGLSYKIFSTKLWYAWDFSNAGDSAWYLEANADVPLPADFALVLHGGYSFGNYWKNEDIGLEEYYDLAVGVTRTIGRFDVAVKYIDGSDLKSYDGTPNDVFSTQGKFFLSVSTTFPWAE